MRVLILVLTLLATPAFAYDPNEALANPAQEARARELFRELRCMVCQNQSIDDSDAPLAQDLRTLVRERVAAGASDAEIKEFLVARYGEFVLLKPRISTETYLLWATPLLVLIGGAIVVITVSRRTRAPAAAPLTDEERAKLDALQES
jgi:cytochrome c-type biogenesis protein CcmH